MADPQSNALEVTVTELSGKLKRTVEDTFGHVRVRGEISGFRGPHSSGHCYFSLKDDRARLEAVIWRGQAAKLKHMPEEGLEVIASGKLTTYPGSSKYQIVIDNLEPAGAGALMALLEERRKKLAAEGLFEEGRKQLLPFMPKVIGVITSPTGAVIHDILHRIADRFPVHVIVWPVRVQGESSGREVANGIYQFNNLPEGSPIATPDLLIVARGGGSLEDLWGFNDEALVRAAAGSMIPVISAVGHETDWTLIDHVADWRAPTPTAAAEKAVPVKADMEAVLADLTARLRGATSRNSDKRKTDLRAVTRGLASPDMLLAMPRRRFDEASGRLGRGLTQRAELARGRYKQMEARLSPHALDRLVRQGRDRFVRTSADHEKSLSRLVLTRRERFDSVARQIRLAPLETQLLQNTKRLNTSAQQLNTRFSSLVDGIGNRLDRNQRLLKSLSYQGVLARGYAVVKDANDLPIKGISNIKAGTDLIVQMHDGNLGVTAKAFLGEDGGGESSGRPQPNTEKVTPKKATPKKPPQATPNTSQGSLF